MQYDQHDILAIVDAIYAAALDPSHWGTVAHKLSALVGDGRIGFHAHDFASGVTDPTIYFAGHSQKTIGEYLDYYSQHNPWTDSAPALAKPGKVLNDWELVPRAEIERSELFNDCFAPDGAWYGATATIFQAAQRQSYISAMGPKELGQEHFLEVKSLLETLMPHLQRSLQISRQMQVFASDSALKNSVIDGIRSAVLIVDPAARLQYANTAGERVLSEGTLLTVRADRTVVGMTTKHTLELHSHIAAAAAVGFSEATSGGIVAIRQRPDNRVMPVMVAPVRHPEMYGDPYQGLLPMIGPKAMIFAPDLQARMSLPEEILRLRFDLTPAETVLATALASGQSLAQHRLERGITDNTVRTLLKRIFDKTHTNRQAELVALVHATCAPFVTFST
ncbi:MAG: helix-turn-helix transcriptional regulator [Parasphingorhabdus sp.]